jgi:hypothetical protein
MSDPVFIDALTRHEMLRRDLAKPAGLFPMMTEPQPDTAERKRRELQAIPFALPPKKEDAPWR